MNVYLLWHIRHVRNLDGGPTVHRDQDGELTWNEQDGDDLKILGVYSSKELAEDRIRRARDQPGFHEEPDCFMVSEYQVDRDEWREGFVTVTR